MRWKIAGFLLFGLVISLSIAAIIVQQIPQTAESAPRSLPPTVGAAVASFDLPLLGSSTHVNLSKYRGKAVLLNFWATWCPPCEAEMPLLEQTAQAYPDQLIVLGVNNQEDDQTVNAFIAQHGITFPIALDTSGMVADQYFARNFPTTYFVDDQGILRAQHLGALTPETLIRYLKTIGIQP